MGKRDRRSSLKMNRRKAQAKKKESLRDLLFAGEIWDVK